VNHYLVDTNVFLYARGKDHPYRDPCRAVLRAAGDRHLILEASVEIVQEYAHVLLRRGVDRSSALEETDEVRSQCRLHAFDNAVLTHATRLLRKYEALGVRDAVHAATAVHAGLPRLLSADRVFETLEEITRVDPAQPDAPWLQDQWPDDS
jgi:hypothetical protein